MIVKLLDTFPFVILGFHSDNGSQYMSRSDGVAHKGADVGYPAIPRNRPVIEQHYHISQNKHRSGE